MKEWTTFNVNNRAKVKLTDVGIDRYRDYQRYHRDRLAKRIGLEQANTLYRIEPVLDKDGYYENQLYEIMRIWGDMFVMGCKTPFNTNILLEVESNAVSRG